MSDVRVVVTLDGSDLSAAAVPVAAKLALGLGAEVTLLRVIQRPHREPAPAPGQPTMLELEEREAVAELREFAPSFPGLQVRHVVLPGLSPADVIVDWLAEHRPDFVVMATHGRSGLRQLIAGSVTEAVLRSGIAPVVAVRPTSESGG